MATQPAVPAPGYLPKDEGFPRGEVDSLVWVVFVQYKKWDWKAMSIWLRQIDALRATQRYKQRQTRVVSVYVPGLMYTAIAKLRTAEKA